MRARVLISCIVTTLLALSLGQAAFAKGGNNDRTQLEYDADSDTGDASVTNIYEQRANWGKFSVELAAQPGGSFTASDIVQDKVAGQTVGSAE